jgi:Pex14 N-terminal domain
MSRPELVNNAVAFLRDPSVAESPLAKRIAFLENKGLNQSEIDKALRLASQPNDAYASGRSPPFLLQQHQQGRDWRDWFIMTVVGGTVGYMVVSLARVSPAQRFFLGFPYDSFLFPFTEILVTSSRSSNGDTASDRPRSPRGKV